MESSLLDFLVIIESYGLRFDPSICLIELGSLLEEGVCLKVFSRLFTYSFQEISSCIVGEGLPSVFL